VRSYWQEHEAAADLVEGRALNRGNRPTEALPLLERAVILDAEVLDREMSPVLAAAQTALAECLTRLGRHEEARKFLAAAHAIQLRHKNLEKFPRN
jgi:tetratricopeptide (TPR) repeat protein